MSEKVAPTKSGEYVPADLIIQQADETYETQGISDRYSTGLGSLNEYMSGGFGKKNSYEMVLVASAPKQFKTTLAMQMLLKQIENKTPMYWMLAEMSYGETLNSIRAFYQPEPEKADKFFKDAIDSGNLKIACKETLEKMSDYSDILTEIKLAHSQGAELFYIDPLNYLIKRTSDSQQKLNMNEFKFIDELKSFLEKTKTTALLVIHNTKDPNLHRGMGLAGTADYPRIATKVIETRVEKRYVHKSSPTAPTKSGKYVSVEMWSARGIECWDYAPIVIKAENSKRGIKLSELSEDDYRLESGLLNPKAPDAKYRELWPTQRAMMETLGCNNE